jgi:hypothetical protein
MVSQIEQAGLARLQAGATIIRNYANEPTLHRWVSEGRAKWTDGSHTSVVAAQQKQED